MNTLLIALFLLFIGTFVLGTLLDFIDHDLENFFDAEDEDEIL